MSELQSVLHDRHVAAGAKFASFGGWQMPLEYAGGGVLAEHQAVRTSVGVFDVSHLGKARIIGVGARDFVNRCLTNDLGKIQPGKAQYTMLCTQQGGVVDDMIAYLISDNEVFLIPNAANNDAVVQALTDAATAEGNDIEVRNEHRDHAVIAVQGSKSDEVLSSMGLPTGMDYMAFSIIDRDGQTYTVCRTGYTGEKGYELVLPAELAGGVWDDVMAAGSGYDIRPCGLGARDTLRTEMGYALHGHEISTEIDPVAAGSGWAVGWKKTTPFIGSASLRAIKESGPQRRSRALLAHGRGIPRPGMSVLDAAGKTIGEVTSGTFSPTLKKGIALALVDASTLVGDEVGVQVRNRVEAFDVVKAPFVAPGVRED